MIGSINFHLYRHAGMTIFFRYQIMHISDTFSLNRHFIQDQKAMLAWIIVSFSAFILCISRVWLCNPWFSQLVFSHALDSQPGWSLHGKPHSSFHLLGTRLTSCLRQVSSESHCFDFASPQIEKMVSYMVTDSLWEWGWTASPHTAVIVSLEFA